MPDLDPKAQEYGNVLASQTLMQARLEKLEREVESYKTHTAQLYAFLLQFGKAIEVLQGTVEFLMRKRGK